MENRMWSVILLRHKTNELLNVFSCDVFHKHLTKEGCQFVVEDLGVMLPSRMFWILRQDVGLPRRRVFVKRHGLLLWLARSRDSLSQLFVGVPTRDIAERHGSSFALDLPFSTDKSLTPVNRKPLTFVDYITSPIETTTYISSE